MKHGVYLDNAATTRVRPEVADAVAPFLSGDHFGNPSSGHALGRAVKAAVERARQQIADVLGIEPDRIVFTSGGTEADNLALLGTALAAREHDRPMRVAVSAIEHKAVLDAAKAVERMGGEMLILPVDEAGRVTAESVETALSREPALVSVMWVNNETGTTQNVAGLAELCNAAGTTYHTDAVQALGKIECALGPLPNTMAAISGHKIGAPKGVGALILAAGQSLEPMIHGGGQQRGVRPGTENVVGIVGLGVAVELAVRELPRTAAHTGQLRARLERGLLAAIPDARVNGATGARAPHISSISLPGTRSDSLTMHLDLAGVYCSTGSACNTGVTAVSHVLSAIGIPDELARATVRFSFSHDNDETDVDRVIAVLPEIATRVRAAGSELS